MPFLTISTITFSWMTSTDPQADSWSLGHVEPDDVVIADIAGQALDILLHGQEFGFKNGIIKTFTHTSIPIHPCTLLKNGKNNNSKMLNSPNMMPSFTGPLLVQCGAGRLPGSLATAAQGWSTSEDLSPRTVLTKNICRSVQHILQHFQTTMPFLTVSTITFSWMASTAPQANSWWLGHMEPDDVVIADIAGQALDILLHGPQSALKNGIIKTFTHTSIPLRPCTLLKNDKNNSKMINSPNITPSFTGRLLVHCAGGRLSGSFAPAPLPRSCRLGQF